MGNLVYEGAEQKLKEDISLLMHDWKEYILKNSDYDVAKQKNVSNLAELFISDGFYPNYTSMPHKILFVGKFCPELAEDGKGTVELDYIQILYDAIKNGQIGVCRLDNKRNRFNYLMLKVAYGIRNDVSSYNDLLESDMPDILIDKFAVKGGFSYAFMNISKLKSIKSLEKEYGIKLEYERDFVAKEIEILNPHAIITMNLHNKFNDLFKNDFYLAKKNHNSVFTYKLNIGSHSYDCLDIYSFTYWNNDKKIEEYYNELIKASKEILKRQPNKQ